MPCYDYSNNGVDGNHNQNGFEKFASVHLISIII